MVYLQLLRLKFERFSQIYNNFVTDNMVYYHPFKLLAGLSNIDSAFCLCFFRYQYEEQSKTLMLQLV